MCFLRCLGLSLGAFSHFLFLDAVQALYRWLRNANDADNIKPRSKALSRQFRTLQEWSNIRHLWKWHKSKCHISIKIEWKLLDKSKQPAYIQNLETLRNKLADPVFMERVNNMSRSLLSQEKCGHQKIVQLCGRRHLSYHSPQAVSKGRCRREARSRPATMTPESVK